MSGEDVRDEKRGLPDDNRLRRLAVLELLGGSTQQPISPPRIPPTAQSRKSPHLRGVENAALGRQLGAQINGLKESQDRISGPFDIFGSHLEQTLLERQAELLFQQQLQESLFRQQALQRHAQSLIDRQQQASLLQHRGSLQRHSTSLGQQAESLVRRHGHSILPQQVQALLQQRGNFGLPTRETISAAVPHVPSIHASMPQLQQNAETHHVIQQARFNILTQLEEVIKRMEPSETADYLTALQVTPHLISAESDPFKFLRSSDFDTQLAAHRLVQYWKRRRAIFGERALRPISFSGEGAMTQAEVDSLLAGFCAFLPNDRVGRTVVLFDSSRRLDHSLSVRTKLAFYIGQVISENERSQMDGFVVLGIISQPKYDQHSYSLFDLVLSTFPLRVSAFHLCKVAVSPIDQSEPTPQLPEVLKKFWSIFKCVNVHIHDDTTNKQETVLKMEAHGFFRTGLPQCLGGLWSYDRVSDWHRERIRIDQMRYPVLEDNCLNDSKPPCKPPPVPVETADSRIKDATASRGDANSTSSSEGVDDRHKVVEQDHQRLLGQAMQQIAQADKSAYLDAMQNAPDEVKKEEADVDRFLRIEDLHYWSAAKRLTRYWKLREEIFTTKKYRPIDQTGEGALERKELAYLGTGFLSLLPNDTDDCSVMWIDSLRIREGASEDSIQKCIFYMFSLLGENSKSQTHGATLLYFLHDAPFAGVNLSFLERLSDCLPIRFKTVHLLSTKPLPHDIKSLIRFSDEVLVHTYSLKEKLADDLTGFGLDRRGIPKRMGGEWGYEKFVQWQELRTRFEWKIPVGLSGRDATADAFNFPPIIPYSELSEAQKTERKRRMNVIHSRRKRDRERIELDVLQEHCAELRDEKEKLIDENSSLEGLLQSAERIVLQLETRNQRGQSLPPSSVDQRGDTRLNVLEQVLFPTSDLSTSTASRLQIDIPPPPDMSTARYLLNLSSAASARGGGES